MDYKNNYNLWLQKATHPTVVQSLQSMQGDEQQIPEAFSGQLKFGTAGLRGIMTAGTNRMNVYTVFRATKGLAQYMCAHGMSRCAITYDSRLNSQLFSQIAAATLAAHGITVHITQQCMPTPFLSFLVRHYGCDMGINITASHNPSQYNGYKVYDNNGCQLTDAAANEVTWFIEQVQLFQTELPCFEQFVGKTVHFCNDEAEKAYVNCVLAEGLGNANGLTVAYTPLNGAGHLIVPSVLHSVGVECLHVVEEQSTPDGNFPTCPYPNPEKAEALSLAMDLAKDKHADMVIATDPDCDRIGVAIGHHGNYCQLSGNQVGVLLTDYVLGTLREQNALPVGGVVVKTIVTTSMVNALASHYGVAVVDVLTGFKYIGEVIAKLEQQGKKSHYLFGFEESCGYLKGTYVRDKDGVVASMLIAQCAAYYKRKGLTLVDRLNQLYEQFGIYYQQTISYRFDGLQGQAIKQRLLADLRTNPIATVGESAIVDVCDFLTQTKYDLPKSDVMRFVAADGSQLIVRPSGTEPIVKCYVTVVGNEQTNAARYAAIKQQIDAIFAGKL